MEFVKNVGPIGMIFIMFSLGLNLTAKDFLEVVKKPRNLIIALICQMIILPVIGIIIISFFPMQAEFQLGVFLLLILPSAVMSNYATKLVKGNVALSITITSFCALVSFISIPIFLVVVLTQIAVGGINFAPKALQFKGKKINPIEGLKRMFSQKALAELVKAILKVLLLFGLTAVVVYERLDDMIQLTERELSQAVIVMGESFPQLLFVLLVGLAIIAAIDYFWQRHIFIQGLRMTKQEIKDEFKQTEGSPEVKAKIRRKQMEASANAAKQASALNDVKDATAVITNPTHFAVALKYEVGSKGAPTILALGKGAMAKAIMERAEQANITLFRSPLLARALFFTSEIGKEISEKLYSAVAVALAYIYKIDKGELVDEPQIDIPEDLRFNENGKAMKDKD